MYRYYIVEVVTYSDTRWCSRVESIWRLVNLRHHVDKAIPAAHESRITADKWLDLQKLAAFLQPFSKFTSIVDVTFQTWCMLCLCESILYRP